MKDTGMTYRVATKPDGQKRWWTADEAIPADHTDMRPSTDAEAAVIAEILRQDAAGQMPDAALGERITALLAAD